MRSPPQAAGYEVLKRLTSSKEDEDVISSYSKGANACVGKPA